MNELVIRLPRLHAQQLRFRRSQAKRKVIVAGRRGGKTTGVAAVAIEKFLAGYRVLEAAPTADQTNAFWLNITRALAEPIAAGIVYKNESERVVRLPSTPLVVGHRPSPQILKELGVDHLPTTPQIRCKTAHDADTMRGDYADFLILDEFSIMKSSVWSEVGAPMLLDNNGESVMIFTPKRKNHAHAMFVRALSDTTGRWESFKFTSFDNPYLSQEALAEITGDMTEDMYKQEILAEFLDSEGAVFRNISNCMTAPDPARVEDHRGHRIVLGGDWGQQIDYTCFCVGCVDCRVELERDRFKQINYEIQKDRLRRLILKWRPDVSLLELNSIGLPIFQSLEQDAEICKISLLAGFETTGSSKGPLIQNLALALEKSEWAFQNDPIWSAELESYEQIVSKQTGRSSYSAPDGVHDDTVIARALMVWQSRHMGGLFDIL